MKRKNISNRSSKKSISKSKYVFTRKNYISGDGMLTTIWGPSLWHYLHTMSFNYPVNPTKKDKIYYKNVLTDLVHTLPCKHCRDNLKNNFKVIPLNACHLLNRTNYSKYVYNLHEVVNKMLNKKSGLTYCDVRELYEHFRSRCTTKKPIKTIKIKLNKTRKKKESGCTEPLYGQKSKCIIKIVPINERCKTFTVDKKCIKTKIK